jgi:hypothetical protein
MLMNTPRCIMTMIIGGLLIVTPVANISHGSHEHIPYEYDTTRIGESYSIVSSASSETSISLTI